MCPLEDDMADRERPPTMSGVLRQGLHVSAVSIGWTLSASAVAVSVGLAAGSLVLVAFGLTGVLDAAGSAALVVHFRHALRHDTFSERRERLALRVITGGLFTVGGLTAIESARRLITGTSPRAAPAGVALATTSIVVLAALSTRKVRVARRIPSRALLADGWLTAIGSLLAIATVAGTGLTSAFGWTWVDPAAAMAVAFGAIGIGGAISRGGAPAQDM
jgi:divalent metal cation (Fe/Co/Zn/Cd) transporter